MTLPPVTVRSILLAAGAFSASMLAAALVAQYGFGLHPCELCLFQRYPYLAVVVVAALAWRASPRAQFYATVVCGLLFVFDAGLAFYHAGVELSWFKGPDACSSSSVGGETIEELRAQILNAPLVSCSQAMAYVFGLSLAAWNAIAAACAAVATFFSLYRARRP